MSYDFFLLYTAVFGVIGSVFGLLVLAIAYRNRIALRSLLAPLRLRPRHELVKPITLQ